MLKDGFLFYYADSERKDFERHQVFNMHPKVSSLCRQVLMTFNSKQPSLV